MRLAAFFTPLLLALSLCACPGPQPTEVRVRANATWAFDDSGVVLVEARYDTTRPDEPWFATTHATNWRTVFLHAGRDLGDPVELATFPEPAEVTQGGGVLSAPLHYLAREKQLVGLVSHEAVGFDVEMGKHHSFHLPDSERERLFRRASLDLTESATPTSVAPSPDGTRVAVFHSAPYAGPGGFTDLRFLHALAIHRLDGTFERAVSLSPWDDTSEELRLDLPAPVPDLPNPAPGEGAASWQVVPVHHATRVIWDKDSNAVFVLDIDRDASPKTGRALRIDIANGTITEPTTVPALALPTRGGGCSHDGTLLTVFTPEGNPNASEIRAWALDDWTPFGDVGRVPLSDVDYAW